MKTADIHATFAQIVADSLMIEASQVTEDATLEELGAESLDIVEISMETESKFNIWLPDKSILDTAIDVAGRSALLEGQALTGFGKKMFRARLPREEWSLLEGDVTAANLRSYFLRVATWIHMIEDLRAHTPSACPHCDGPELSPRPGFTLVCEGCGEETKLRSGQEINREWVEGFLAENSVPAAAGGQVAAPADVTTVAQ